MQRKKICFFFVFRSIYTTFAGDMAQDNELGMFSPKNHQYDHKNEIYKTFYISERERARAKLMVVIK